MICRLLTRQKILAYSAMEANAMGDAWFDTDHLLLGTLCESNCQAAQQLNAAGLTLENARSVVMENRPSLPDYGPVIPLGTSPSPRVWLSQSGPGGRPAEAKSGLSPRGKNEGDVKRQNLLTTDHTDRDNSLSIFILWQFRRFWQSKRKETLFSRLPSGISLVVVYVRA